MKEFFASQSLNSPPTYFWAHPLQEIEVGVLFQQNLIEK
jgi:hypothetical protein